MQQKTHSPLITRLISKVPFHPVLLSMFSVLFLYKLNYSQIDPTSLWRPLILSVALACFFLFILFLILRNLVTSALIASIVIFLFFSYGHIYTLIKPITIFDIQIGRHRYLIVALLILSIIAIRWFTKDKGRSGSSQVLTGFLNIFSLILVLIPSVSALSMSLKPDQTPQMEDIDYRITDINQAPDIYYIIVDAYARQDSLLSRYHYDNSEFIQFLEDQGFYVAHNSQANYLRTISSLAATLNFDYLQNVVPDLSQGQVGDPKPLLDNNRVRRFLENSGYTIVALASGWNNTEWLDADYVLTPNRNRLDELMQGGYFTPFENLLLETTAVKIILDFETLRGTSAVAFIQERIEVTTQLQREVVMAEFDNLELSTQISGPKFIFAHIISPHPPYLFGPNGEFITQNEPLNFNENYDLPIEEVKQLYVNQLIFINKKLQQTIEFIIENNDRPTVIILQSDHGKGQLITGDTGSDVIMDRASILYSIYLDEDCYQYLYPSISPVNTFRVVFNCYFDGFMPLQEDVTYNLNGTTPLTEAYPELSD